MHVVDLLEPTVEGQTVTFEWRIDPEPGLYKQPRFQMTFPASLDLGRVPARLWWDVFLIVMHQHWLLLRPCQVRFPLKLSAPEKDFWLQLLRNAADTIDRLRTPIPSSEPPLGVEIIDGDLDVPATTIAGTGYATSFSSGKDSLLQAALLFELTGNPLLVTTTSPIPPMSDHLTARRREVFAEIVRRRDPTFVEVVSDCRANWDNEYPRGLGYRSTINELTDTFVYLASLLIASAADGRNHLFLASEAEVQESVEVDGVIVQHPHFMYSAATQRALSAYLQPYGFRLSALIWPLYSMQVQQLLWARYPNLSDLQYSCWRVGPNQKTCSQCEQCMRISMIALADGHDPQRMGIDLFRLMAYSPQWDPKPQIADPWPPGPQNTSSPRSLSLVVGNIKRTPLRNFVAALGKADRTEASKKGWEALEAFKRLRARVADLPDPPAIGVREAYLEWLDPDLREAVSAIFAEHLPMEPRAAHAANFERNRILGDRAIAKLQGRRPAAEARNAASATDPLLSFLGEMAGRPVNFYPHSGNAGDGFITHATFALFEKFGIAATALRQDQAAPDNNPVLIGGGGNFVEDRYADVSSLVARYANSHEVVVLPQTIVGFADLIRRAPRLRLFCRERVSFDAALANGAHPDRTFLTEDVTLFLPPDHFADVMRPGVGTLYAMRRDQESALTSPPPKDNQDISQSWNGDIWTSPAFARHVTMSLAAFIAQYESVVTDRLHVAILASLLGRQTLILPNAFAKVRAVFDHSIGRRFPASRFFDSIAALAEFRADIAEPFFQAIDDDPSNPHGRRGAPLPNLGRLVDRALLETAVSRLRRLSIFSGADYLKRNADVRNAKADPYSHAIHHGAGEGRQLFARRTIARALATLPVAPTDAAPVRSAGVLAGPVGIYLSSQAPMRTTAIAEALVADLRAEGVETFTAAEDGNVDRRPACSLFVEPQRFFNEGEGVKWLRGDVLASALMVNAADIQTHEFERAVPLLLLSKGVIDVHPQTAALLDGAGIAATFIEPKLRQDGGRLNATDRANPLFQSLPRDAQAETAEPLPLAARSIDIAFCGNVSRRRDVFLARAAPRLAEHSAFIHVRWSHVVPSTPEEANSRDRIYRQAVRNSRILLQIHRDEFPFFDWYGLVWSALRSGTVVVTDTSLPHPVFKPGVHFVEDNIRYIPDRLDWLLRSAEGRKTAERIHATLLDLVADDSPATGHRLLDFLRRG